MNVFETTVETISDKDFPLIFFARCLLSVDTRKKAIMNRNEYNAFAIHIIID